MNHINYIQVKNKHQIKKCKLFKRINKFKGIVSKNQSHQSNPNKNRIQALNKMSESLKQFKQYIKLK